MATILGQWYSRIKGGWKTVGVPGLAAFDGGDISLPTVGPIGALRLSAYFASSRLISETMGILDFELKDRKNNIILEHDLYGVLQQPNQWQTQDQFISAITANATMFGNGLGHIKRYSTGNPYGIDFYSTDLWQINEDIDGRPSFSLHGEPIPYEDVFHIPGFSVNGYWGIPALLAGADVLRTQVSSNDAAQKTFASGLKVGGFFRMPPDKRWPDEDQIDRFDKRLAEYSRPGAANKWMLLLPGLEPVPNTQYKIDPMTAELLQSRYFGVEEICRVLGVPPPLIGHTDKASSWASSLASLNQFLVDYTLLPRANRMENVIAAKLLSKRDRARLMPEFNMDSLLRGDLAARWSAYNIARQTNVFSPNDVLRKEGMPDRPDAGGNSYTVETSVVQKGSSTSVPGSTP